MDGKMLLTTPLYASPLTTVIKTTKIFENIAAEY